MSKNRQPVLFDPRTRKAAHVITLAHEYVDGHVIPEHFHDADQFVYAIRGVMTVRTAQGIWVVPPQRAVWIPVGVPHRIDMSGPVSMRTLYFPPRFLRWAPRRCLVTNVDPLLRELIVHTCASPSLSRRRLGERRLVDFLVDRLATAPALPLQLPALSDPRAARVAERLLADPGGARSLAALCRGAGASLRTIERLFREETGFTLGKWRQQLRLMHSLRLLAQGEKVITVALESGYDSPSAFISMFRKALGKTPSHYVTQRG